MRPGSRSAVRPPTSRPRQHRAFRLGVALAGAGTVLVLGSSARADDVAGPSAPVAPPAAIEEPAPFVGQAVCDPTAQPGTRALAELVLGHYGTGRSGGIVRNCDVGGPSEHKEGRAWDWMLSADVPEERAVADRFLAWLGADGPAGEDAYNARRLGVMYVIWNRAIWSPQHAERGWLPYDGADPHTGHLHISLSWSGALGQTSWWTGAATRVDQGPCTVDPGPAGIALPPQPCPPLEPASPDEDGEDGEDGRDDEPEQPTVPPEEAAAVEHTVVAGDTLSEIALVRQVSVDDLRAANGLTTDTITVGQTLLVPTAEGRAEPAAEGSTTGPEPAPEHVTYTVVAGDTLSEIALARQASVDDLRAANGLTTDTITVGQTLLVPTAPGGEGEAG